MSGAVNKPHEFIPPPPGEILGHPRPLWMLFGAEFWERFAYYGMRALLAVYVAQAFFGFLPESDPNFSAEANAAANAQASLVYGGYTALVYATGIAGGMIADRYLGYQRSIIVGGILMAIGLFMLLSPSMPMFMAGLAVIVAGNGLFKPNISTMVGHLYAPGDVRRDSGFTIFYMGINAGAFIAPMICSAWIGATYGLKYGFLAASIGMIFGIMVFQFLKGMLGHIGRPPAGREGWGPIFAVIGGAALLVPLFYFLLTKSDLLGTVLLVLFGLLAVYLIWSGFVENGIQGQKYIAMFILFAANILFWALFEQAGASLNFLARDNVAMPTVFGYELHFTLFQSANPMFIILLAPLFAMLWPKLEKMRMNPSIPRKFAIALIGLAAGYAVLVFAIKNFGGDGEIAWIWLLALYAIHTMAELCLSPIGLSMVTKLAAPKNVGLSMGGWFLATAVANFVAGRISAIASGGSDHSVAGGMAQYAQTFTWLIWAGLAVGLAYFFLAPAINKLMHGVK
jgi:proton-dependent oligopeptide transporter, POT family